MRPQRQKHLFNDGSGIVGDCHRTCIAMILNMDRDDVPHFMAGVPYNSIVDSPEGRAAQAAELAWLASMGLTAISLPYNGETPLDVVLEQTRMTGHGAPVLLGCTSGNGVNHSVVIYEGEVYNPNGDGTIAGPMQDGHWWLTIYSVGPNWQPSHLLHAAQPASVVTQED